MDLESADEVIEVHEHLKIEWMYDRQLVVFTVTSLKRDVIDLWADHVQTLMREWNLDGPFYNLHDYTGVNSFMTTPHLRKRSKENTVTRPDLITRPAICIPNSVTTHIVRVFVRALPKQKRVERARELFTSREAGMKWLLQKMRDDRTNR